MNQINAFTGTATSFTAGDLSIVTAGSTDVDLLWRNISDFPIVLSWRKTGQTDVNDVPLEPDMCIETHVSLTSARTVEYKVDAGSVECDVLYFFGTGLTATLAVSDVIAWLEMNGYTISATGNLAAAEVTLCLSSVTNKMTKATTQYTLITGKTLDSTYKDDAILHGAIAESLLAIHNQGISSGLGQNRASVDPGTIEKHQAEFEAVLSKLNLGLI